MKKLIGLIAVVGLLLAGCAQPSPPPEVEAPEPPPELYDKIWISPGKVEVGNFYPGARAEYMLTIHNGKDEPAKFSVTYRQPDNVAGGERDKGCADSGGDAQGCPGTTKVGVLDCGQGCNPDGNGAD
jgi:hypothetical protein